MFKQKIKILIILAIFIVFFAISAIFYQKINVLAYKFMLNNKIVSSHNNLLVHFISVGQGDAIAINFPSGNTMLIDCGPTYSNVDYAEYIKNNVINNSTSKEIEYLVLTHADADHIGGALKLLKEFDVEKIYLPNLDKNSDTYLKLNEEVKAKGNYEILSGKLNIEEKDVKISTCQLQQVDEPNDACPVIKIEYLNKSFLFAADVSADAEKLLIEEYKNELNSDVLKLAHHGSKDSTCVEFLDEVTPKYGVISVGKNGYGHPNEETLERLEARQIETLRTDKNGNVLFVVGNNYNLAYTTGEYNVTNLTFDYRIFVLCVDLGLTIVAVIVVVKNLKQKSTK